MNLSEFNFAQPLWLWALAIIPCAWIWTLVWRHLSNKHSTTLEKFADPALLPHLIIKSAAQRKNIWLGLIYSGLIACLVLALANPRWDYKDVEAYSPAASMVILLDLSSSMNARDVAPSRIIRARQSIQDLLELSRGLKVGIIGFAAIPHMISPITDDIPTIEAFLPAIDTDLVHKQGNALAPAINAAADLLLQEPGDRKSILLISDGNFASMDYSPQLKALAKQNVQVHVMGVGTSEGAPYADANGKLHKVKGTLVNSTLNKAALQKIAKEGGGIYIEANYSTSGLQKVLAKAQQADNDEHVVGGKVRYWEDRYYILFFPAAILFMLLLSQRTLYFVCLGVLINCCYVNDAQASVDVGRWFRNPEQQAQQEFSQGNFNAAAEQFNDPYHKGVALYRAGQYAAAEKQFKNAQRTEIQTAATYNAGNSQMQQKKWRAAIKSYEQVLEVEPENDDAKFNLELAKKMLAENDDKSDDKGDDQEDDDNEGQGDKSQDDKSSNKDGKDKGDSDKDDSEQQDNKDQDKQKNDDSEQQNNDNPADEKDDAKNENTNQQPDNKDQAENEDQKNNNQADARQQQADQDNKQTPEQEARAQQWLNRINSDMKVFLRNKFYIEDMVSTK